MEYTQYCNNCIYKRALLGATPVFELQGLIAKMNIRFHETRNWEEYWVEEKYTQYTDYKITGVIENSDI